MASKDDRAILEAGYQPKLRRSLGYFASFAVSFSFISITTGIFANYGYVLTKAGPFGFWTWPLVSIGHVLVALVYAEMAGRMPLAGCAYNWNTKLAGRVVGWFSGWLTVSTYSIAIAAVTATAIPVLASTLGMQFNPLVSKYITAGVIVVLALVNISGIQLTSKVNILAVCAEIVSIVVMGCLVAIATFGRSDAHISLLTTVPAQPQPYWQGFLLSCLLGAWTLVGFETSADMSEETVNATSIAPKGVISSILVSVILGFAFIVVMTVAIPDVKAITAADNPLIAIVSSRLGEQVTRIFMVFVVIAIFSCTLINITAASRILYAMARDRRFIASSFFQRVSDRHVPVMAIVMITIVSICFVMLADSLTALYAASAIVPAIIYLITIVSFAAGLKKLPKATSFSLGRWHWPTVILATLWLIIEIGILTLPKEFRSGTFAVGGVLAVGIVIYLVVGSARRH